MAGYLILEFSKVKGRCDIKLDDGTNEKEHWLGSFYCFSAISEKTDVDRSFYYRFSDEKGIPVAIFQIHERLIYREVE